MSRFGRRGVITLGLGLLALLASVGGVADGASANAVKGSPQPELTPFTVGSASGGSDVVLGPNHTLVIAWQGSSQTITVCVLDRGARSCAHKTTLSSQGGSTVYGNPLLTVSGNTVELVMDECCAEPYLLFVSSNGGRTFGAASDIGTTSTANLPNTSTGERIGNSVLWGETDQGSDNYIAVNPFSGPPNIQVADAQQDPAEFNTVGLGSYHNGALVAAGDFNDVTKVSYAPDGTNFGAGSSYQSVGSFAHSYLIALTGNALVTQLSTGSEALQIRTFTGSGWTAARSVPDSVSPAGVYAAEQDPTGRTFVFTERSSDNYNLYAESTTTGASWSRRVFLGNAVDSESFTAALDGNGTGVAVGASGPVQVHPLLAAQAVSFTLSRSRVYPSTRITLHGHGSSPQSGRAVLLERLIHGLWYTLATTHENAAGNFTFHLSEPRVGDYTLRAQTSDLAGFLEYGYSAARTLAVVKR